MATRFSFKTDPNTYRVKVTSSSPDLISRLANIEVCDVAKAIAPFLAECFVGHPTLDICVTIGDLPEDMAHVHVLFNVLGLGRCDTRRLIQSLEKSKGQLLEVMIRRESNPELVARSAGKLAFLLPLEFLWPEAAIAP
uniref:hypothetical protein n=1 Tax=Trichocoleus desertorum TaxID=1481672 RepID=UPI0025B59C43|nr:hypothetical protein [Trichocoleus desertorum]